METEVDDTVDVLIRYYGNEYVKEADFPMNLQLLNPELWTASGIEQTVMQWMEKMPEKNWPNWIVSANDKLFNLIKSLIKLGFIRTVVKPRRGTTKNIFWKPNFSICFAKAGSTITRPKATITKAKFGKGHSPFGFPLATYPL